MNILTRLIFFYYIAIFYHGKVCITEKLKKKFNNFSRFNSSNEVKIKTIDVSDVSVETLEELSLALKTVINKRLINTSSTIEMNTKNIKPRLKIHNAEHFRNLNLNSVQQIDNLLHKAIMKRFHNINYNDETIKKRVGKSPKTNQLIKSNYNPVFDANKLPDLDKRKLCRYDLDFQPVKIINNDNKNILNDVKLNVLTRKNIENCS